MWLPSIFQFERTVHNLNHPNVLKTHYLKSIRLLSRPIAYMLIDNCFSKTKQENGGSNSTLLVTNSNFDKIWPQTVFGIW